MLAVASTLSMMQAACGGGGGGGGSPTGPGRVQAADIGGGYDGPLTVTVTGGGCVGKTLNERQFPAVVDSAWSIAHPRDLDSPADVSISDAFEGWRSFLYVKGQQIGADGTSDENGAFSAMQDMTDCGQECSQEFDCSNGSRLQMVWQRTKIDGRAARQGSMTGTVESLWSIRNADGSEIALMKVFGDLDCQWSGD